MKILTMKMIPICALFFWATACVNSNPYSDAQEIAKTEGRAAAIKECDKLENKNETEKCIKSIAFDGDLEKYLKK